MTVLCQSQLRFGCILWNISEDAIFFFLFREVKKRKGKLNEDLDLTMGQIVFYDYDDLGFNSNLGVSAF